MEKIEVDLAVFNPTRAFKTPQEILDDTKIILTLEQKIRALQTWKYDIQLRRVAEAENMHATEAQSNIDLEEENVLKALEKLRSQSERKPIKS